LDLRVILVPYDSSHFSENALDYAVYLAKAIFLGDPKKKTNNPDRNVTCNTGDTTNQNSFRENEN
jgi:hypothetical protein